jgi:hypothetical protein
MTTPTIFHYGHKLTSKSQNQIGKILEHPINFYLSQKLSKKGVDYFKQFGYIRDMGHQTTHNV